MKLLTIVPAAGSSVRMQQGKNKAFIKVGQTPLLALTLQALAKCSAVSEVIVVVGKEELSLATKMLVDFGYLYKKLACKIIAGGAERQYSVANALAEIDNSITHIAIHDGARPFITPEIFTECLNKAVVVGASIVAVPSKDTIKFVDEHSLVLSTPDRKTLWNIQTPQIFAKDILLAAYTKASQENFLGTDDASLVEYSGAKVAVTKGSYDNIKLTTPEDLTWAEYLTGGKKKMQFRVGTGYDVHQLVPDRKLILGGVEIAHSLGLLGHSDADVLLHAIKDALLGAAGLGDIGKHFPDTDAKYKGISSMVLLEETGSIIAEHGWQITNIDATIMAEKPKIAPHKEQMRANIAKALKIAIDQVNIKATTTEKLGFVGREEGMAAQAVAGLFK